MPSESAAERDDMAKHIRQGTWRGRTIRIVVGLALGLLLGIFVMLPASPATSLIPIASAHALLVSSDPAADAILRAPPPQVSMWFSEDLNAQTSRAVVVDPSNRRVDRGDSHVNPSNSREMDVSLPLLAAGTYVVAWTSQSAVDGHIVGGSFIFRIARPDGSVPPLPTTLPSGHFPGAAGSGAAPNNSLDGPTLAQTAGTWLALLFMTFWVGGLIWQTWILPSSTLPSTTSTAGGDPDLAIAAHVAAGRFRKLAPYALIALIWADIVIVLAQAAELAGGWSGVTSAPLLRAILFGSRFGTFWWMREIVALAALLLVAMGPTSADPAASLAGGSTQSSSPPAARPAPLRGDGEEPSSHPAVTGQTHERIPDWRREVVDVLRRAPRLPGRLGAGVRGLSWWGRAELALGAALLVAFALSGHAAAVQNSELAYALGVDLLHLLCEAAWVGGLFYIGIVFVPALTHLSARQRARVLALGLPEFGVVAILSAGVLAATGSLNTTIHLSSASQFLTTAYGRTLAVKIEFFLIMVAISAYHAFILRPRLAVEFAAAEAPAADRGAAVSTVTRDALVSARAVETRDAGSMETRDTGAPETRDGSSGQGTGMAGEREAEPPVSSRALRLAGRLEDWLLREAMIGCVVLLCVALLAAFAGSLSVAAPGGATGTSGVTSAPTATRAFTQTQSVGGYSLTLTVTPGTFGTNTFTVVVHDGQGKPVDGASVLIQTQSLDMDMGTQTPPQLQPVGASAPGAYSGQSDLTMAGHWQVTVKVLPPGSKLFVQAVYKFIVTY